MATKEFKTTSGHTYEVRPTSGAIASEASRNVAKLGIKVNGEAQLHENALFSAELCRLVLVKWTKPDGTTPLEGLSPAKVREFLLDADGLKAAVLACAQNFSKEIAAEFEVDSGN